MPDINDLKLLANVTYHGDQLVFATVDKAIRHMENLLVAGESVCIYYQGEHVATVGADDAGTVAIKHCCERARKGDWDELAGGALHCPLCGEKVGQFRQ